MFMGVLQKTLNILHKSMWPNWNVIQSDCLQLQTLKGCSEEAVLFVFSQCGF
jgi:hypothetical protein